MPAPNRPDAFTFVWMRWIRKSINALLPVAGVGGDIASARLAHKRGVPGAKAAAAMVVDTTVGVATQLVFVVAGVRLLAVRSRTRRSPRGVGDTSGTAVLVCAIATFVLVRHRSMFVVFASWRAAWPPEGMAARLDGRRSSDRRRRRGYVSSRLRLLARQHAAPRRVARRRRRYFVVMHSWEGPTPDQRFCA